MTTTVDRVDAGQTDLWFSDLSLKKKALSNVSEFLILILRRM